MITKWEAPEASHCEYCNAAARGHAKCLYCQCLLHNMSKVKNKRDYFCSCGINHTKTNDGKFCVDCLKKGYDKRYDRDKMLE